VELKKDQLDRMESAINEIAHLLKNSLLHQEKLLTLDELAKALAVSKHSLYKNTGLPIVRVGGQGRNYYILSEVIKHLNQKGNEST
jgi:phosphoenolpyruvate carboxylase